MSFDFENGFLKEFKDNNEISCSLSRNTVSHEIDFKAVWLRNGHAASLGVNIQKFYDLKEVKTLVKNLLLQSALAEKTKTKNMRLKRRLWFTLLTDMSVVVRSESKITRQ